MRKHAALYTDELRQRFIEISDDLRFQYYHAESYRTLYKPTESTWHDLEQVSVSNSGEVIGYLAYSIDRDADVVHALRIVNFTGAPNTAFATDLRHFLQNIFEKYNHRKLRFTCFTANPALRSYRRLCKRFGGREVGIYEKEDKLLDGYYHDLVLFEILRDDYFRHR